MREIKFRAWDGKNMFLSPSSLEPLHHLGSWFEAHSCYYFSNKHENSIIMQYTGLKDKNGKEIYEDDICESWITENKDIQIINRVVYQHGAFGYIDLNGTFHSFAEHQDITKPIIQDWEVIGNIHQNPEIL